MYSALRLLQNLPTRYLSYRYVNLVRETAEVERRLYVFFVAATPLKVIVTSACTFLWILLRILPWKLVLDILRGKKGWSLYSVTVKWRIIPLGRFLYFKKGNPRFVDLNAIIKWKLRAARTCIELLQRDLNSVYKDCQPEIWPFFFVLRAV